MALAVLLAALCLSVGAMSIPKDAVDQNDVQVDSAAGSDLDEDRRATWLETRELEDEFKELVFLAVQELQNEGRISSGVVKSAPKDKRGRWQGFCFRRTRSGRFLPYICWKGGRK